MKTIEKNVDHEEPKKVSNHANIISVKKTVGDGEGVIVSPEAKATGVVIKVEVAIPSKLAAILLPIKVVTHGYDVNRGRTSRVSGHLGA